MQGMGDGSCPYAFNFDPETFKVGDWVSFRVPSVDPEFRFAGVLLEVHEDHVIVSPNPDDPSETYKASRESRPVAV
jgi:hypothetical protein